MASDGVVLSLIKEREGFGFVEMRFSCEWIVVEKVAGRVAAGEWARDVRVSEREKAGVGVHQNYTCWDFNWEVPCLENFEDIWGGSHCLGVYFKSSEIILTWKSWYSSIVFVLLLLQCGTIVAFWCYANNIILCTKKVDFKYVVSIFFENPCTISFTI